LGPNTRCYEHPDRLAGALCRSCNRPICADCMVEAPVGWHCRRCVHRSARTSPVVRYRPSRPGAPQLGRAPVTAAIVAACVVLYVASSSDPRLLDEAADWGALVHQGQWWRLFTAIFFHVDFLHIALNMVALWVIGRVVEPVLGTWRYIALFLLSGLGGSVASYLLSSPASASVGASGAIFGLFGAYFVLARRAAADTTGVIVLIAVNLLFSFTVSGISWQGHIGGLVTGLVLAAGFGLGRGWRGRPLELAADAGVVGLVSVALALLMLLPPGVANLG
jgi:membrane associated rhomboid family serine protease